MNLVRKYKISKILNQPLTSVEQQIILFIQSWLKDLIPFKMDEYSSSIFYMNSEGLYVLEQNTKSAYIYVRWKDFWNVLEDKYLMKYKDIQDIIKFMVEEAFKQKVATPLFSSNTSSNRVEEAFKQKVATPIGVMRQTCFSKVEEAFKQKVKTPMGWNYRSRTVIEEAFKQKVKTPQHEIFSPSLEVEEAFKKTKPEVTHSLYSFTPLSEVEKSFKQNKL